MTHKVIIADDSKNIQKVVEIILDERECEIQACSSEAELFEKLEEKKADIVFLDFSLSDNKDGYDLANILKNKNDVKVIILFGTFDAVDENKIEANKIEDYIFKPFDAEKFLNIYDKAILQSLTSNNLIDKSLAGTEGLEDNDPMNEIVSSLDAQENFPVDERTSEQDWGMDLPPMLDEKNKSINPGFDSASLENELPEIIDQSLVDLPPPLEEISDLVPELPPLSGMDETMPDVVAPDLPPLIEDEVQVPEMIAEPALPQELPPVSESEETVHTKLPSNDDLEYPGKLPDRLVDDKTPSLVPIGTLNLDQTSEKIHLEKLDLKADEEKLSKLKEEILGELEDDLWDENTKTTISLAGLNSQEAQEVKNQAKVDLIGLKEEIKQEFQAELKEDVKAQIIEKLSKDLREDLEIEIRKEVLQKIRQELPTIVKNFCADELVQEVWKIVPEISEKLISSELEEIRNSLD